MADLNEIAETLSGLTVMEAAELATLLEEKWGVSAAAPVAVAAGPAAGGDNAAAAEQTEFDAVLISFGDKKIQVIKEVRAITGLGLKEAKALVEGVPTAMKEGIEKEEAEAIKAKIEEVGARSTSSEMIRAECSTRLSVRPKSSNFVSVCRLASPTSGLVDQVARRGVPSSVRNYLLRIFAPSSQVICADQEDN